MSPRELTATLNTLLKVYSGWLCDWEATDYANASTMVSSDVWEALAKATKRLAPEMTAQQVADTVYALSHFEQIGVCPISGGRSVQPSGWVALAEAVERTAPLMNAQQVDRAVWALVGWRS